MFRKAVCLLAVAVLVFSSEAQDSDLAVRVRRSIDQGVDFLKRQQRSDGSWPSPEVFPDGGISSLAMLALLESGVKSTDPVINSGLRYLRNIRSSENNGNDSNTYVVALQTMVG